MAEHRALSPHIRGQAQKANQKGRPSEQKQNMDAVKEQMEIRVSRGEGGASNPGQLIDGVSGGGGGLSKR